jgi:hypothetical protein
VVRKLGFGKDEKTKNDFYILAANQEGKRAIVAVPGLRIWWEMNPQILPTIGDKLIRVVFNPRDAPCFQGFLCVSRESIEREYKIDS